MIWAWSRESQKREQIENPQVNIKLEKLKTKGEINKTETKKTIELINKTNSWIYEKQLIQLINIWSI